MCFITFRTYANPPIYVIACVLFSPKTLASLCLFGLAPRNLRTCFLFSISQLDNRNYLTTMTLKIGCFLLNGILERADLMEGKKDYLTNQLCKTLTRGKTKSTKSMHVVSARAWARFDGISPQNCPGEEQTTADGSLGAWKWRNQPWLNQKSGWLTAVGRARRCCLEQRSLSQWWQQDVPEVPTVTFKSFRNEFKILNGSSCYEFSE